MAQEKDNSVHRFSLGRVTCVIRSHRGKDGRNHLSFTLSRFYQSGDQTRESFSFYRDDAPLVAKAADIALAWLLDHEASAAALDE